jgi:hypothetical protein
MTAVTVPEVLTDRELRELLKISKSHFYDLKERKKFVHLMCQPQLTGSTRYSGKLVAEWMEGRFTYAQSFGRKRA